MERCINLDGIQCLAVGPEMPSQAIELEVVNEANPTGKIIRACRAAGWPERRRRCTGNPDAHPLQLEIINDTAWIG